MCNGKKGSKDNWRKYPFFCGYINGVIGRPPLIYSGMLRTAASLGLLGQEAYNQVVWENFMTRIRLRYAYRLINHYVVPHSRELISLWDHLPVRTQQNVFDWGNYGLGNFTGGFTVSALASRQLIKFIPKKIVFPAMIIINCQGYMSWWWNNNNDKGPPPPSAGGGSGGKGLLI